MPEFPATYYIEGLFRQPNAARAREYLGIQGSGGTVNDVDVVFTNNTTGNASVTKHGFLPRLSGSPVEYLSGDGTWKQVKDTDLSLSDNTTNNVSTANHGFTPKLPNDATKYLDGTGNYTVPAGSGGSPGGIDKNVQYNNSGAFGGVTNNGTATSKFLRQVSSGTPSMEQVADVDLSLTDNTTNNVSTANHGFTPKLDNIDSNFLDGTGNWSNPTGGMAIGWFRYDNNTTIADPGTGDFRMNTTSWGTVTTIAFDQISDPGNDVTAMIMMLRTNDQILIQKKNDSTIYGRFTVTATPTNHTGWFSVPVTNVVDSGSMPSNTQLCAVVVSYDGGGSSSGTVTNTGTLTDHAVIVGNGGVDVSALSSLGAAGELLTSNGAGADPSWQPLSADSNFWREIWLVPNVSAGTTVDRLGAVVNTINGPLTAAVDATSTQVAGIRHTSTAVVGNQRALHDTLGGGNAITSRPASFLGIFTIEQTTNIRGWIGLTSSNTVLGSDTAAVSYMGFRFSTPAGDTSWQAVADNASGTPTVVPTGVSASGCHRFVIEWTNSSHILYYIDGTLVADITTTVPTAALTFLCGIECRDGTTARSYVISILRLRAR